MPVLLKDEDQLPWRYTWGLNLIQARTLRRIPGLHELQTKSLELSLRQVGQWLHEIQLGLRLAGVRPGSVTRTDRVSCI